MRAQESRGRRGEERRGEERRGEERRGEERRGEERRGEERRGDQSVNRYSTPIRVVAPSSSWATQIGRAEITAYTQSRYFGP